MSEPAGRTPDPEQLARFKRQSRNASIAGVVTLIVVMELAYLLGNDTVKSYSFFVGVVPALIVYFAVAGRGLRGPKH